LNALGEPSIHSIGIGSYYTPTGWFQLAIEALHVDIGLTWYQAIALSAVVLRLCLLPITVKAQKNTAKMRKLGPDMAIMQEKMSDAKATGNNAEC
jgi:YidC/Oxa1 family membrane protein insertase